MQAEKEREVLQKAKQALYDHEHLDQPITKFTAHDLEKYTAAKEYAIRAHEEGIKTMRAEIAQMTSRVSYREKYLKRGEALREEHMAAAKAYTDAHGDMMYIKTPIITSEAARKAMVKEQT